MSLPTDRARFGALALLAAAFGCHSDDDSSDEAPPYATLPVIAGCEQQSFEACDPLDEACQARVFETMKCLRQMPDAVMPPVRVLTKAEQLAEFKADPGEDPEAVKSRVVMERGLLLLHLAEKDELSPDNQAQVFVDTTAAYYNHNTGLVTLSAEEGDEPRGAPQPRHDGGHVDEPVRAVQPHAQPPGLVRVRAADEAPEHGHHPSSAASWAIR